MKTLVINVGLLLLLVVTVIFNWVAGRDFSKRNWVVFPEMMFSVPADAYAASTVFDNKQTMQNPVEGTIARGFMPLGYEATPEDAKRAGEQLRNPYTNEDQAVWERGRKVYAASCLHCHGASGAGDGTVATRGFPPPPSFLAENAMQMPAGQMFHVITYGQKNMPGHAAQVARDDRWKVIAYIMGSIQKR